MDEEKRRRWQELTKDLSAHKDRAKDYLNDPETRALVEQALSCPDEPWAKEFLSELKGMEDSVGEIPAFIVPREPRTEG